MSGIREALGAAFDKAEAPAEAPEAAAPEPAAPAPETPPAAPVAAEAPAPVVEVKSPASPGRDEKGRFAPKAPAEPEAKTPEPAAGETPKESAAEPEVPAEPALKPPQSWKPAAREKWAALPPEVQQEAVRVDREVQRVMREAAPARKLAEDFIRTVAPFEAMIRAEGSEPLKAVGNLLQTAAALRTAPPAYRAQLVAQLVRTYQIPIDALDAALVGEAPKGHDAGPVDAGSVAQQVMAMLEQQSSSRRAQHGQAEVEQWSDGKEFFDDVREDMADLLEAAAKRGKALTLDDAYKRALQLHPDVSQVLKQREAAEAAKKLNASAQRAKAAGVSVKTEPEQTQPAQPKSIRAALAEAASRLAK